MATEPVVSYHSSPSQEVEKEEMKKVDTVCASDSPKESAQGTKPDVSSCEAAAPSAEAKIEEKQIEPHVAEHAKDSNTEEEPKTLHTEEKVEDKAVAVEVPPSESTQEKVEDKLVEVDKKIEDDPVVEASDKAIPPEPTVEKSEPEPAEKQVEEKSIESKAVEEVEKVVDVPESLPAAFNEKIEEKVEEPEKVVEVPESLAAEVIEKIEEKVEEPPTKVVEAMEAKDEAESKPEEITQPAPQSEVIEEVKKETPVAEAVEEVEAKSFTDKADDAEFPKKEETGPSEAPSSLVHEENVVPQLIVEGTEHTEPAAEPEKIEEKTQVAEELVKGEDKPTEDSKTSTPTPEPAKKVVKDEATSRGIELVADNVTKKCETGGSPEEVKETEKEEVEEAAEAKLVEEKQVDEKIKETVEANEVKLEDEKKVDEAAENIKGSEDTNTKTTEDVPKEDVPVKTQKQSIVKIVKQSLVKAKKAIIGKSNNSKTPAPESKDDGKK